MEMNSDCFMKRLIVHEDHVDNNFAIIISNHFFKHIKTCAFIFYEEPRTYIFVKKEDDRRKKKENDDKAESEGTVHVDV